MVNQFPYIVVFWSYVLGSIYLSETMRKSAVRDWHLSPTDVQRTANNACKRKVEASSVADKFVHYGFAEY